MGGVEGELGALDHGLGDGQLALVPAEDLFQGRPTLLSVDGHPALEIGPQKLDGGRNARRLAGLPQGIQVMEHRDLGHQGRLVAGQPL